MEIIGKATGICSAYIGTAIQEGKFDSSVGRQISTDVVQVFSLLTYKNAQIAIKHLSKALEEFGNAPPDIKAEKF